jgi:hypothetical protein
MKTFEGGRLRGPLFSLLPKFSVIMSFIIHYLIWQAARGLVSLVRNAESAK